MKNVLKFHIVLCQFHATPVWPLLALQQTGFREFEAPKASKRCSAAAKGQGRMCLSCTKRSRRCVTACNDAPRQEHLQRIHGNDSAHQRQLFGEANFQKTNTLFNVKNRKNASGSLTVMFSRDVKVRLGAASSERLSTLSRSVRAQDDR